MTRKLGIAAATLACCVLVVPAIGSAQTASSFPGFIPFATPLEGVAVDKVGHVFVSVNTASGVQVWKYSPAGDQSLLVDMGPGQVAGQAAGLAVDAVGNVYVAQLGGNGVYQVSPQGEAVQLPGTEKIVGANALAFDQVGTVFITETFSVDPSTGEFRQGGIWRVPRGGVAELWLRDELLTGFPPLFFPYPVGANGIGFYHGALYVANTDKALVVRIPVLPDGSPGQPEVWKQVGEVTESFLAGSPFPIQLDGLALDVHGNVYVAVPSRNAIVRINADNRSQETIAAFPSLGPGAPPAPLLDSPLSLTFGTGKGERQSIFITNGGMLGAFLGGTWPGLSLVKIEVAFPGQPMP